MTVFDVVHRPVKLLLKLDMNGRLLREVVSPVDTEDRILQLVLTVRSLVRGNILGELVMPFHRIDRALDLDDFDVRRRPGFQNSGSGRSDAGRCFVDRYFDFGCSDSGRCGVGFLHSNQ
jgi:hypothetical protein